jgi:signal transduction histidine kinase
VGNATIVTVSDNGPGIAPNIRERLFMPFASARRGGTGLGLAIARELARAHGGDLVLAESGAGGTRFRLTIPDRGAASNAAAVPALLRKPAEGRVRHG